VGNNVVDFDLIIPHVLVANLAKIVVPADNFQQDVTRNITTGIAFLLGLRHPLGHRENRTDMSKDIA
jgi:hypothetical protein